MDKTWNAPSPTATSTVVQPPVTQHLLVGTVLVAIGVGLGLVMPSVLGWALGQDWLPFRGPLRLLDELDDRFGPWLLVLVGAILGLVGGVFAAAETMSIAVTGRDITFVKGEERQRFARSQIAVAVLDGNHLVLRDHADVDLTRRKFDVRPTAVVEALRRHDWPLEIEEGKG